MRKPVENIEFFDYYKDAFNDKLRDFMGDKSVMQFSKDIGIPDRTIHDWLRKISLPRTEYLIILAKKFDCSIDYLLGLEN